MEGRLRLNPRKEKKFFKKEVMFVYSILVLCLMFSTKMTNSRLISQMEFSKENFEEWNDDLLLNPNIIGITKEWCVEVDEPVYSSPIVIDIDKDGSKDILVGFGLFTARPGGICCIENNGSIKWTYDVSSCVVSSPAIADIDNDNSLDIIFNCKNNITYCLNFDGTLKWEYDLGHWSYATPCIADLDGDGSFEIIAMAGSTKVLEGVITCLSPTGIEIWSYYTPGWTHSSPLVADLDKDGKLEVIAGCSNTSDLFCLDYQGNLIWTKNLVNSPFGWGITGSPIAADIDNDLELEIIVSNSFGTVFCLDQDGNQEWNYTSPTTDFFFSPIVSYLDSDPYLDIIIGSSIYDVDKYVSFIRCLDYEGNEAWSLKDISIGLSASTPITADINDDGEFEIIFTSINNFTYIVPNIGVPIISSYRTGGINVTNRGFPAIASTAAVVDIDDDGVLEIIVGSDWLPKGKIWCLEITGTSTYGHTPYSCFRGSMFRTGWMDRDSDYLDDLTESRSFGTNIYAPDTDDDGLLDGEEIWYNTDPLKEDTDGDGFTDGVEINCHKDPLDPNDFPAIDSDGDGLDDDEEESLGTDKFDDDSDNDGLKDGDEVYGIYNPNFPYTVSGYILGQIDGGLNASNADSDHDGLRDGDEYDIYFTNLLSDDTDNDGMTDGWEVTYSLNPKFNDAAGHADDDSLTNLEEFNIGCNPNIEDSDNDTIWDDAEVRAGTNPLDPDDHPILWNKWNRIYSIGIGVVGFVTTVIGTYTAARKLFKKESENKE